MPYHAYGRMDRADALAIVAYLRTLPARPSDIPERHLQFPVSLLVRTLPAPAQFATKPEPSDRVAYGQYLATIGGCAECHTPVDEQRVPQLDRALAGGQEFVMPNGAVARTANLTPTRRGSPGGARRISSSASRASAPRTVMRPCRRGARTPRCPGAATRA
jgi:mono/diheme cytochrome c family protein